MATTPYVPSILIDAVIDALADFIQPFVGDGTEIMRAQTNRTPMPLNAFVELKEISEQDLETPIFENNGDVLQATLTTPTKFDVQIDFYGPSAGDWCKSVKAVYRSIYAVSQFPDGMVPLYCSDGIRGQLITGEEQYENRWILTASLQYNPVVSVPQQSAVSLKTNIFEDLP
jgi:hypothetical protein